MIVTITLATALAAQSSAQASPGATLIDRTRADRPRAQPTAPAAARPDPATAVAVDAPDMVITGVRFVGTRAPARVAAAARPYLGRHASRQTLGELAAALAAAYAKSEVALYTVAIPGQNFARGIVTVRLVEGRIAGVDFGAPAGPQLRARLTPLTTETPLTRATFERQLTLARAIPGLTLATDLTDPRGTGALRLAATPKQKRRKLTAGYSSRGVDLLGAGQLDLAAEIYGVLNDGDQVTGGLSAAPDLKRYRLATAGYSTPVGSSGLTAGLSGAYLETRPKGRTGKGTAKQLAGSLSYPVVRTFTSAGDVSLSLDGLDSDDAAIAGVVAQEHSRALRLAAGYSKSNAKRFWSVAAAVSRGLGVLNARSADSQTGFTKLTGSASIAQVLTPRLTARVSASGQLSRDRLPAAERFAIGGDAIGRAFDEALLSGDRGGGGLAELAWRPVAKGNFSQSELYGFVDRGTVRIAARGAVPAQQYSLASAGAGGRLRYREKAELGLEAARVIDRPYPAYRDDWQITASWRLTL